MARRETSAPKLRRTYVQADISEWKSRSKTSCRWPWTKCPVCKDGPEKILVFSENSGKRGTTHLTTLSLPQMGRSSGTGWPNSELEQCHPEIDRKSSLDEPVIK